MCALIFSFAPRMSRRMEDPKKRAERTNQHLRATKANAAATKAEWDTPMRPKGFFQAASRNTTAVGKVKKPATTGVYKWRGGQEQANSVEGVLEVLDSMEKQNAQ